MQANGFLIMLAVQAFTRFMQLPNKPPVTAALIAAQTLIHLRPGKLDALLPTISDVCLNPYLVIQGWDLKRLWLSAFYHVDDTHLVYNMISLLWKGTQLETTLGSGKFAAMLAVLLGLSHGLAVASSLLLSFFTHSPASYSSCAVGFSGVLFALKVVLNYNSPSYTNIYGVLVPSRYAAWVELLFIQMFVPGTSFVGHLCGILAGLIYMNSPAAISGSLGMWPVILRIVGGSRHRTYGRGSVGSRRDSSPPPPSSSSRVWRCQSCTYDNSSLVETCDMCGAPRTSSHYYDDDISPSAPPLPIPLSREELRQARLSRFYNR